MKLTFYGHACFTVETDGVKLLFDPFISGNPLAKDKVDIRSIQADYVLLSHGHGDHVGDAVEIIKQTGAKVICMAEVAGWLGKQGIEAHQMNYGSFDFPFGRVTMTPAWHSSSMPDGSYGGNPAGFVVKTKSGAFYYSGDTSLMLDMQLIPHYATVDFAVLPIGGNFTMDARDAVKASDFIQCNKIIGVHYDTFGYIKIDKEAAQQLFADAGKELLLPEINETLAL